MLSLSFSQQKVVVQNKPAMTEDRQYILYTIRQNSVLGSSQKHVDVGCAKDQETRITDSRVQHFCRVLFRVSYSRPQDRSVGWICVLARKDKKGNLGPNSLSWVIPRDVIPAGGMGVA